MGQVEEKKEPMVEDSNENSNLDNPVTNLKPEVHIYLYMYICPCNYYHTKNHGNYNNTVFHWLDIMVTIASSKKKKTEQLLCEFAYYKPSPSSFDVVLCLLYHLKCYERLVRPFKDG